MFLAGFDLSEDPNPSGPDVNGSIMANLTAGQVHSVELMGVQCGKECYAIGIAAALTFLAGIYQVNQQPVQFHNTSSQKKKYLSTLLLTSTSFTMQVMMAVFRLGFISVYLSAPMLDGFATGASFTILTVQAKYLLGLKIPRHQGYGTVVVTWINIFANIHKTNLCDLITSAICLSILGKDLKPP